MAPITPTLGDLRRALADGQPPPGEELLFDLADTAPPGYLPDCLLVTKHMIDLVRDGVYDRVPDTVPIAELTEF